MNKKTKVCILIIMIIVIISAGGIMAIRLTKTDTQLAQIWQDGQLIRTIDLKEVTDPYEIRIDSPSGGYNVIGVAQGKIAIIEASCPDKVCVNTGYISDSLMPITCLPNKLMIRITSNDNSIQNLDGISH